MKTTPAHIYLYDGIGTSYTAYTPARETDPDPLGTMLGIPDHHIQMHSHSLIGPISLWSLGAVILVLAARLTVSRSSACAMLLCVLAVQSSTAAQRVARTLPGNIIAAAITNAPAGAKISVPKRNARPWAAHAEWKPGDVTTYSNAVYCCVLGHRSQTDWSPNHVPALWRLVRAADQAHGEIPLWVQPHGAHDAYAKGTRVRRGGHVWVSTIANNVWAPGVYGWQAVN